MKTSRWPIIVIIALVLLLVGNFIYTFFSTSSQKSYGEHVRSPQTQPVVRVKNAEEKLRMEQYIADYYRPLKIVKTIDVPGREEKIDCVDINTQPGMQHKGMENERIQLKPSQVPSQIKEGRLTMPAGAQLLEQEFLKIGGPCPQDSIPLRRLTIDTLVRFTTLEDFFKKEPEVIPIEAPSCGGGGTSHPHEYAHAYQSIANWGAESFLNVWNVWVEWSNEFALSQIWVVRGSGGGLQTLEAGWQSYEDKYDDWNAHLFIYSTQDNYQSHGCYNLECGQFVQTNGSVYIAGGFSPVSSYGGGQWGIKLLIARDPGSGNWWLWYGDQPVGYWPNSLFNAAGLANQADSVDFGGEIVNSQPDGRHTDTDMGSGNFPSDGWQWAAFQSNLSYVDTNYYYADPTLTATRTNAHCYDITLTNNSGGGWGDYFYFGGPGRNPNCP